MQRLDGKKHLVPLDSPATEPRAPERTAIPGRRRDIQGLRAIAVLAVVAFHAGLPVPGGFVGVDIFFVISGFVITAMLHREWHSHGRIRMGTFYWRRFKRLTPALALMVSVTLLASAFILSPLGPQQTAAYTGTGASLIVANFVIAATTGGYFDAPAEANPLLHTWSLSVEEQFYLLFPAVMAASWLAARRFRKSSLPALAVAAIALASFGLVVLEAYGPHLTPFGIAQGFYGPLTRCWEFAVGALLALAMIKSPPTVGRALHRWVGVVGLAMLAASMVVINEGRPWPSLWTLLPVVGTLALLWAGSTTREPVATTRLLGTGGMVTVGDLSYSIYLWHWPFIVFAGVLWPDSPLVILAAAALSFLPAVASYHLLEQPIRVWKPASRRAGTGLVAVALAVPLALSAGLLLSADKYWKPRIDSLFADAKALPATHSGGCFHWTDLNLLEPPFCEWHPDASGRPVYLIGDSNVAHFSDGMIEATAARNRPLYANTSAGCPNLLDVTVQRVSPQYAKVCSTRTRWVMDWLAAQTPGTVVLGATDDYWLDPQMSVFDRDGDQATTETGKVEVLRAALTTTVEQLQAAGHDVVLVQTIPHFTDDYKWDPATCSISSALKGCPLTMPLAAAHERSAAVRATVSEVAEQTGAEVVDIAPALCPDGQCNTRTADMPAYRDGAHISVAMSRSLADEFEKWIAQG